MSAPTGCDTLKWMLPSPRWPKATTRAPGANASTAGVASLMKAGTRPTSTETSCLIEPPFLALRLGQALAQLPEGRALLERGGDRGVLDDALLERRLERAGEGFVESALRLGGRFDQHEPVVCASSGARAPPWRSAMS